MGYRVAIAIPGKGGMLVPVFVCPHLIRYPCPTSIGPHWNTGTVLGSLITTQLCTGILLGMHYTPGIYTAYYSVIHISREVYQGSVYRLLHSGGSSGVFLGVYIHGGRGVSHGSHMYVSSVLSTGPLLYLVLMAVAFLGYVLPWGLMSYWGATVITNLYTGVPCMVPWLWGGFYLAGPGVSRYFIVHPVLPLPVPVSLVLHGIGVHRVSSSNGTGYGTNNRVTFHPWIVPKDTRVLVQGILVVLVQVYHGTLTLAHPDNSLEASAVFTPLHIVPEWYYLGYYGVLKAIPGKASGFLVMVSYTLGTNTPGEPYGTSPLQGTPHCTGRYTLVLLVSLAAPGTLWIGVQLPGGILVSVGRVYLWVSLGCDIGYTLVYTPYIPPCTTGPIPGNSPTLGYSTGLRGSGALPGREYWGLSWYWYLYAPISLDTHAPVVYSL